MKKQECKKKCLLKKSVCMTQYANYPHVDFIEFIAFAFPINHSSNIFHESLMRSLICLHVHHTKIIFVDGNDFSAVRLVAQKETDISWAALDGGVHRQIPGDTVTQTGT